MSNNLVEGVYVSASLSENGIPDMHTWEIVYNGKDVMHVEVDVPDSREGYCFGLSWITDVPTQRGLDAIRESYQRLKNNYVETSDLKGNKKNGPFIIGDATYELSYEKRDFFPLLVSTSLGDSEHSDTEMSSRTSAMNLADFLNPDSLRVKKHTEQNPLLWIRVDTEYTSFYFQGEQKEGERGCGIIDSYKAVDEVVRFYQDTAKIRLPTNAADELRSVLDELLETYPDYVRR
jgi:hypothetical protein